MRGKADVAAAAESSRCRIMRRWRRVVEGEGGFRERRSRSVKASKESPKEHPRWISSAVNSIRGYIKSESTSTSLRAGFTRRIDEGGKQPRTHLERYPRIYVSTGERNFQISDSGPRIFFLAELERNTTFHRPRGIEIPP